MSFKLSIHKYQLREKQELWTVLAKVHSLPGIPGEARASTGGRLSIGIVCQSAAFHQIMSFCTQRKDIFKEPNQPSLY
eukprot:8776997-Ditylum_brightwellii.AAC.1